MPSAFPGGCPTVTPAATQSAELDVLVAKVRSWTEDGVDASEIAVATRFHQLGSRAKEGLLRRGFRSLL
jgi:hypothetical protein